MNKTETKKIKEELLTMKEDMINEFKLNQENGNSYIHKVGDNIDQAADSSERELIFELNDIDRAKLDSIKNALGKIDKGTYGVCERCRKKISKKRIKAKPDSMYCIKCKSEIET